MLTLGYSPFGSQGFVRVCECFLILSGPASETLASVYNVSKCPSGVLSSQFLWKFVNVFIGGVVGRSHWRTNGQTGKIICVVSNYMKPQLATSSIKQNSLISSLLNCSNFPHLEPPSEGLTTSELEVEVFNQLW